MKEDFSNDKLRMLNAAIGTAAWKFEDAKMLAGVEYRDGLFCTFREGLERYQKFYRDQVFINYLDELDKMTASLIAP